MFWGKKKIIVTHNGTFHADDVFACAILSLYLKQKGEKFKITRTRDEDIFNVANYLIDVGAKNDESTNSFDHHQEKGAGKRENGIEYASFGLVWKKFGRTLCENDKIWEEIDKKLVTYVDAGDNGQEIILDTYQGINPYTLQSIIAINRPILKNETDDKQFSKLVKFAENIISREIISLQKMHEEIKYLKSVYERSESKEIIVLNKDIPRSTVYEAFKEYEEILFIVSPNESYDEWKVTAMRSENGVFTNRKDLPIEWTGKRNGELAKLVGVEDAIFCHRKPFLIVVKTKESAIKLAKMATEN